MTNAFQLNNNNNDHSTMQCNLKEFKNNRIRQLFPVPLSFYTDAQQLMISAHAPVANLAERQTYISLSIFMSRLLPFDFYVTGYILILTFYSAQFHFCALNLSSRIGHQPRISASLPAIPSLFSSHSELPPYIEFFRRLFSFQPNNPANYSTAVLQFLFSVPFHASNHPNQKRFSPLFHPVLFYFPFTFCASSFRFVP